MRIPLSFLCLALAMSTAPVRAAAPADVAAHYAHIGHAVFEDALLSARVLQTAVERLIDNPSPETLAAARDTWIWARAPYSQSEVFRFGNTNVDDWEGQVNAWPLDEGLIDYVAPAYAGAEGNRFAHYNLIAGSEPITPALLRGFQEKGGAEANVAIGYHAIEFLLWGQDLNRQPSDRGQRPYTDYVVGAGCTHGHCARRAAYLRTATALLVADLEQMAAAWTPGVVGNHHARLRAEDPERVIQRMLLGMATLSMSELAGERINVALLAAAQEEEQSCFSDNTHADILHNARGIENLFLGRYQRMDGAVLAGPGLSDLLAGAAPQLRQELHAAFTAARERIHKVQQAARAGEHFDQQIAAGNEAGQRRVRAVVQALKRQGRLLHAAAEPLGLAERRPL